MIFVLKRTEKKFECVECYEDDDVVELINNLKEDGYDVVPLKYFSNPGSYPVCALIIRGAIQELNFIDESGKNA